MTTRFTAMILTQTGVDAVPSTLAAALRAGGWTVEGDATDAGPAAVLTVGGQMLMLMAQPLPIPRGDLEPLLPYAWMWTEAAQVVGGHGGHLIASTQAAADTLEAKRLAAAMTLAAVAALTEIPAAGALGVYWDGLMLRPASFYGGMAGREAALQALATHGVDHRLHRDEAAGPQAVGLSTAGLSRYIGAELQFPGSLGLQPSEMMDLSVSLCGYVLDRGPVFGDGDTFDGPAGPLRVRHHPLGEGVTQWRVAAAG